MRRAGARGLMGAHGGRPPSPNGAAPIELRATPWVERPPNEPASPEKAAESRDATHGGRGEVRRGRRRVHDVGVSFAIRPPFQGGCPSTGQRPGDAPGSPRMPRWGGSDRPDGAGDCGGRKAGSRPGPLAWRPWHAASSSPLDVTPLPIAQLPFLGSKVVSVLWEPALERANGWVP